MKECERGKVRGRGREGEGERNVGLEEWKGDNEDMEGAPSDVMIQQAAVVLSWEVLVPPSHHQDNIRDEIPTLKEQIVPLS